MCEVGEGVVYRGANSNFQLLHFCEIAACLKASLTPPPPPHTFCVMTCLRIYEKVFTFMFTFRYNCRKRRLRRSGLTIKPRCRIWITRVSRATPIFLNTPPSNTHTHTKQIGGGRERMYSFFSLVFLQYSLSATPRSLFALLVLEKSQNCVQVEQLSCGSAGLELVQLRQHRMFL